MELVARKTLTFLGEFSGFTIEQVSSNNEKLIDTNELLRCLSRSTTNTRGSDNVLNASTATDIATFSMLMPET